MKREELTDDAIALEHARWLIHGYQLLGVVDERRNDVRSYITGGMSGRAGPGRDDRDLSYRSSVNGSKVSYEYVGVGGEVVAAGELRISALLQVAASYATDNKIARLRAAVAHRHEVLAKERPRFGEHWTRSRETRRSPEWWAYQERCQTVDRELGAATRAWWEPDELFDTILAELAAAPDDTALNAVARCRRATWAPEHEALAALRRLELRSRAPS